MGPVTGPIGWRRASVCRRDVPGGRAGRTTTRPRPPFHSTSPDGEELGRVARRRRGLGASLFHRRQHDGCCRSPSIWMFYVAIRNSRHLVATRVTAIVIGDRLDCRGSSRCSRASRRARRFPRPGRMDGAADLPAASRGRARAVRHGPAPRARSTASPCSLSSRRTSARNSRRSWPTSREWRAERAQAQGGARRGDGQAGKEERAKQPGRHPAGALPPLPAPAPVGPLGPEEDHRRQGAERTPARRAIAEHPVGRPEAAPKAEPKRRPPRSRPPRRSTSRS